VPRPVTLPLACAAALLGAGCGAERVQPPDPSRPFAIEPPVRRAFPEAGLRFRAPGDLAFGAGRAPLVTSASTGTATIAIWRYPRSEPLPRDDAALAAAREALVRAARTRDATFDLDRSRRVRIDGAPGIELVGSERVAGRDRRVRSTHVYAKGAEVVVDAYAAPRDFAVVDRAIVGPLLRSLKLDPPRA
jgi:hypothetical protein